MRAILVDPYKREIREVEADFNKLDVLQHFLADGEFKAGGRRVSITAGPRLSRNVHTYLDDEGYYRPEQAWFELDYYASPLAGYMLILAGDEEGNEVSLPGYVSVEAIYGLGIKWSNEAEAAPKIPDITFSTFKEFGGPLTEVDRIPVDITEKRPIEDR